MRRVIDYKAIDMEDEEFEYYNKIVAEFANERVSGKDQFKDIFDTDEEGNITLIRPPLNKEVSWAVIFFLQNLMLNQHIRSMERYIKEELQKIREQQNGK